MNYNINYKDYSLIQVIYHMFQQLVGHIIRNLLLQNGEMVDIIEEHRTVLGMDENVSTGLLKVLMVIVELHKIILILV